MISIPDSEVQFRNIHVKCNTFQLSCTLLAYHMFFTLIPGAFSWYTVNFFLGECGCAI